MEKWFCNKCKVEMEDVNDIKLIFKEVDLPPATGYRCPSCDVEYLDGDYVVDELSSTEKMLEGK